MTTIGRDGERGTITGEDAGPCLVLGGTGKTGRRVAARLRVRGVRTRVASRSGPWAFDWERPSQWDAALRGVRAVYVAYAPDLAAPGAPLAIGELVERARRAGVKRLVLLSGRGEPEARDCEELVRASGLAWTVLRASWFAQNFTEGEFAPLVRAGAVALPAGDVPEPFVDADDIAEAAVAAMLEPGHHGAVYELTGPRALTFAQAVGELADALGRPIRYERVEHGAFLEGVRRAGTPEPVVGLLDYLFGTVLDGRNAAPQDGVERMLGRPPTDFSTFAVRVKARAATAERSGERSGEAAA